jgi:hypothetical protein
MLFTCNMVIDLIRFKSITLLFCFYLSQLLFSFSLFFPKFIDYFMILDLLSILWFHFTSFVRLLTMTLCFVISMVALGFVIYNFNLSNLPPSDVTDFTCRTRILQLYISVSHFMLFMSYVPHLIDHYRYMYVHIHTYLHIFAILSSNPHLSMLDKHFSSEPCPLYLHFTLEVVTALVTLWFLCKLSVIFKNI